MLETILMISLLMLLFAFLILLVYLAPKFTRFLTNLSEKYLSDRIHLRIVDAMNKLENVIVDLLVLKQNKLKELAKDSIMRDGKIDIEEVKDITKELTQITVDRLQTEKATFINFITGDKFVDYVADKISALTIQTVYSLIGENTDENKTS